jgi:hypothetical protein
MKNKIIVITMAVMGNKILSILSDITTIIVASQTKNIVMVTKAYFMIISLLLNCSTKIYKGEATADNCGF